METKESIFSNLAHVGVIVKDIDKAIEYYESLGIGPFEHMALEALTDLTMYGKPTDFKLKVAIAQMGTTAMELIQPVDNAPLMEEFLKKKGEGINHLAFLVDDLEKEGAKMVDKGFKVILGARHQTGGADYFDTRKVGDVIMEIMQH